MRYYISSYNGVLDPLRAKLADKLASPRDADVWCIWQDCAGSYRDLLETCQRVGYKKPTYVVQHGRNSTGDYGPPNNWPLLADYYLCWGESDYANLSRLGLQNRAHVVGCPLFDNVDRTKVKHEEKVVLFVPVNTGKEEPLNIAVYYELLKIKYTKAQTFLLDHSQALTTQWGFNGNPKLSTNEVSKSFDVVAKLLPWHDRNLYHGRNVVGYQDSHKNNELLFALLRNVDLVVGLDEGTTEIFAYAFDVPVITVDGFTYRQFNSVSGKDPTPQDIYRTEASTHTTLEGLASTIARELSNPENKREARARVAERELGLSRGNATSNILNFIKTSCAKNLSYSR